MCGSSDCLIGRGDIFALTPFVMSLFFSPLLSVICYLCVSSLWAKFYSTLLSVSCYLCVSPLWAKFDSTLCTKWVSSEWACTDEWVSGKHCRALVLPRNALLGFRWILWIRWIRWAVQMSAILRATKSQSIAWGFETSTRDDEQNCNLQMKCIRQWGIKMSVHGRRPLCLWHSIIQHVNIVNYNPTFAIHQNQNISVQGRIYHCTAVCAILLSAASPLMLVNLM